MILPQADGNKAQTTSWLPEKFAVKGKFVELKNRNTGEWVNGWQVISVGDKRLPEDQVTERSQDYKNTRKASDI